MAQKVEKKVKILFLLRARPDLAAQLGKPDRINFWYIELFQDVTGTVREGVPGAVGK